MAHAGSITFKVDVDTASVVHVLELQRDLHLEQAAAIDRALTALAAAGSQPVDPDRSEP